MGMTHGEPETFPRIADVLGFCRPEQAVDVAEAVVTVQRDFGDRANRKHARLKYTIDDRGIDWFRAEVERRLGYALEAPRPFRFDAARATTTAGCRTTRATGTTPCSSRTAGSRTRPSGSCGPGCARSPSIHKGDFRLTANQNLIIARVSAAPEARASRSCSRQHGARQCIHRAAGSIRWPASRCRPAAWRSPRASATCRISSTALDDVIERAGLRDDAIVIRMTGCPNGCARPYLAEIGLVGRNPGGYNLYLGAAFDGTRLNKLYRQDLKHDEIVEALTPLIETYARERLAGERFGDFAIRAGHVAPTRAGRDFHAST